MKTTFKKSIGIAIIALAFGSAFADTGAASFAGSTVSAGSGNSGGIAMSSSSQVAGTRSGSDVDFDRDRHGFNADVYAAGSAYAGGKATAATMTWGNSSALAGAGGVSSAETGSGDSFRTRSTGGFAMGHAEAANGNLAIAGSQGYGMSYQSVKSGNESSYEAFGAVEISNGHHGQDLVKTYANTETSSISNEDVDSFERGHAFGFADSRSDGDASALAGAWAR